MNGLSLVQYMTRQTLVDKVDCTTFFTEKGYSSL